MPVISHSDSVAVLCLSVSPEFAHDEKKRQQEELESFQRSLDDDLVREQERHKRNVDALNQRKDDMIRERKQKMKDDLERLKVSTSGCVTLPLYANYLVNGDV